MLPCADRLVVFRADDVLHRVAPVHRPRVALTTWWDFAPSAEHALPPGSLVLLRSAYGADDRRRRELYRATAADAMHVMNQMERCAVAPGRVAAAGRCSLGVEESSCQPSR